MIGEQGYITQYAGTLNTAPVAKEQSLSELSHMVANQADQVAARISGILSRLEGPGPKSDGQVPAQPERPLAMLNRNTYEALCKADQMIGLLERKIFG